MDFWLTEKASAGQALAEVLGMVRKHRGYWETRRGIVAHNIGHLLRQKNPRDIDERWGFRYDGLPIDPDDIPLEPEPKKRDQLKVIEELFRRNRFGRVVLAGDAGREGSLIGRETIEWVRWRGPVARMAVVSYERRDIEQAIREMEADPDSGERDLRVYLEGLCRQKADYWLGMTATVISVLKLKPPGLGREDGFASGGVISPLTALVVDRERAIENFRPREHFMIWADVGWADVGDVELRHPASAVLPSGEDRRIYDRALADRIRAAAAAYRGPLTVERSAEKVGPPRLFDKAALVAKASRAFGWSPEEVLKLAQALYDRGLITYPRTESAYLKAEQKETSREVLAHLAEMDDFRGLADPEAAVFRGSRYNTAKVGEHHAIIPTRQRPGRLDGDQADLYRMIAANFVANHLPDAVDDKTRIAFSVDVDGQREFVASGRVEREPGWRRVFQDEEAEQQEDRLPATLRDGMPVSVAAARVVAGRTEPPRRYTEAELELVMQRLIDQFDDPAIKLLLENRDDPEKPKGLGTAATRGTAIAKVIDELQYVRRVGRRKGGPVAPTDKGLVHVDGWRRHYPAMVDPVTRAQLEGALAEIGDAPSTSEARRRAEAFIDRQRRMLREMVAACRELEGAGDGPSERQARAVRAIGERLGLDDTEIEEALASRQAASAFLDAHAQDDPPSERQAAAVRVVAEKLGLADREIEHALRSRKVASAFLDSHSSRSSSRSSSRVSKSSSRSSSKVPSSKGRRR